MSLAVALASGVGGVLLAGCTTTITPPPPEEEAVAPAVGVMPVESNPRSQTPTQELASNRGFPECMGESDCIDDDPCTNDGCIQGRCVHPDKVCGINQFCGGWNGDCFEQPRCVFDSDCVHWGHCTITWCNRSYCNSIRRIHCD